MICPKCKKQPYHKDAKFCRFCGTALVEALPTAEAASQQKPEAKQKVTAPRLSIPRAVIVPLVLFILSVPAIVATTSSNLIVPYITGSGFAAFMLFLLILYPCSIKHGSNVLDSLGRQQPQHCQVASAVR